MVSAICGAINFTILPEPCICPAAEDHLKVNLHKAASLIFICTLIFVESSILRSDLSGTTENIESFVKSELTGFEQLKQDIPIQPKIKKSKIKIFFYTLKFSG